MSQGQITLTQYSDNIAYCRLYNGAAFVDNDAEAVSIGGTEFPLWADANDWLYVGKASTFAYVGFRVHTAGAGYTSFLYEYAASGSYAIAGVNQGIKTFSVVGNVISKFTDGSHFSITGSTGNDGTYTVNGNATWNDPNTDIIVDQAIPDATVDGTISTIWTVLSALFNNTSSFTVSGYLAWSIPSDWELRTVDSQSAYWVRASQTAAAPTPAKAYHLLRNITLDPPLHVVGPDWTYPRTYQDINGTSRKVDITYNGPNQFVVGITQMALNMGNLQLFHDWQYEIHRIYIEDESRTTPIVLTTNAYYREMQGRLVHVPLEMRSPGKMGLDPGAYYPLTFEIDTVVTQSSLLGLSL